MTNDAKVFLLKLYLWVLVWVATGAVTYAGMTASFCRDIEAKMNRLPYMYTLDSVGTQRLVDDIRGDIATARLSAFTPAIGPLFSLILTGVYLDGFSCDCLEKMEADARAGKYLAKEKP